MIQNSRQVFVVDPSSELGAEGKAACPNWARWRAHWISRRWPAAPTSGLRCGLLQWRLGWRSALIAGKWAFILP